MATDVTIGGNGQLFVGEDKTLRLEVLDVTNVPVDITGWTIKFDVRVKDKAPSTLLSKDATITGVFNASRAVNTQRATVILTDDDMNLFKQRVYRHSWKRMNADSETVLSRGNFTPEKATAP